MKLHFFLSAFLLNALVFGIENDPRNGLVETQGTQNIALLAGAPNGLPGIDKDVANVRAMVTDPSYQYTVKQLFGNQAGKAAILSGLRNASQQAGEDGTLLFYFSGHGDTGSIVASGMQFVQISEIRDAIEQGRESIGSLKRLVLFFDSCHAGSLVDPVNRSLIEEPEFNSEIFADQIVEAFTTRNKSKGYWDKLFVFASSRADELSAGDDQGGFFTLALTRAYKSLSPSATIGQFIQKTKQLTDTSQHPVARLVPQSLSQEKMK